MCAGRAVGEAVGQPGECGRSYADLVARVEACLLDAFGTIVTCDLTAHTRGYRHILRTCGAQPRPELVRALVDRGMELLLAGSA